MTLCQELSTIPSLQTPKPPGASPSLKLTVATVRTDPSVIWIARTLLSAATYTVSPRSTMRVEFLDRKSTRLNSSHLVISYAVFCLKKKKEVVSAAADLPLRADT